MVVVVKQAEDVEVHANEIINAAEDVQLDFAEEKAEVILINNRKKGNTISVCVGGRIITSNPVIEYLRVMIDTCEKATNTSVSLARMLPNLRPKIQSYIACSRTVLLYTCRQTGRKH